MNQGGLHSSSALIVNSLSFNSVTNKCHNSVTNKCHNSVTNKCHNSVTNKCHKCCKCHIVSQNKCHKQVSQTNVTNKCHKQRSAKVSCFLGPRLDLLEDEYAACDLMFVPPCHIGCDLASLLYDPVKYLITEMAS